MSSLVSIRRLLFSSRLNTYLGFRSNSSQTVRKEDLFFDPCVQKLLLRLQGNDYTKVFRKRKLGVEPLRPIYQFMTQEELEAANEEMKQKAAKKLMMPPVMDERLDKSQVLETDSLLQGFDTSKYVFTDITYGVPDRERIIVVRDTDGTLRTCTWEEHDRLNQVYYPTEGRRSYDPAMFDPNNLEEILGPTKYEYVLDRNCLQYEPDHPVYIRTLSIVHKHIVSTGNFDILHSTRHYGPMVFGLCWDKLQDELLVYLIVRGRLEDAVDTVRVYLKLHPDCSLASINLADLTPEDILRKFCKLESLKSGKVSMALDRLLEEKTKKEELLASHGAE